MQRIVPPLDFPITLKISPSIANGMFNQLSQPKSGIKAKSIPKAAKIPSISPKVFIMYIFRG